MYIQAKTFRQSINNSTHQARLPDNSLFTKWKTPETTDFSIENWISYPIYLLRYQHPTNQPTNQEKYLMGNGKCDGQGIEYCCIIAQLPAAKEVVSIYSRDKRKTSSR